MVSLVIVMINESPDLRFQVCREEVVFQQDAVLQGLMPSGRRTSVTGAAVLKSGTRLMREWRGQRYDVLILDNGFEFKGRTYQSLTAIAKEITGTHWSGPRFFGLKRPARDMEPSQYAASVEGVV